MRGIWATLWFAFALFWGVLAGPDVTSAIEIVVDYRFDDHQFFEEPVRRAALEAAAARFSRVINSSLTAVEPNEWRIGFTHPATGEPYQISSATSEAEDSLAAVARPADDYGFDGLAEDTWLLFAGGSDLVGAGVGGTGTGLNYSTVFDDLDGPLHRGLISNTPDNTASDLPAWGGAISFSQSLNWHYELDSTMANDEIDFYSIAMHEIGHALGMSTNWNQWRALEDGDVFRGTNAVDAYNQDNGTALSSLQLASGGNPHWRDGTYQSYIFPLGEPATVGTVGSGLQDLLLEPQTNFTTVVSRFELTNTDAHALVDLGWSILQPADLDLDGSGSVDGADVNLACGSSADLQPYFEALNSLSGDFDFDGAVQFSDFLLLAANFGQAGNYGAGDASCDGVVNFPDFLLLSDHFGESATAQSVPEPGGYLWPLSGVVCLFTLIRRRQDVQNRAS